MQDEIAPHVFGILEGLKESLTKYVEANERRDFKAKCTYEKTESFLDLPITKNLNHYLEYLFNDNDSTFGELSTLISEAHDISEEELKQDFMSFYAAATKRDIVLLRHRNTGSKSVGQIGKGFGLFLCFWANTY